LSVRIAEQISTEILRGISQLEDIAEEWELLWRNDATSTPFQSPQWLIPWWRHFGQGDLRVLAIRKQQKLRALLPFYLHENTLLMMGLGISDYLDVLSTNGEETLLAVKQFLLDTRHEWKVCDFQQLRSESLLLKLGMPPDFQSSVYPLEPCPVLAIPENALNLQFVPKNIRRNLHYYRQRLDKMGRVGFECATADSREHLLQAWIALHASRWHSRGGNGVLEGDAIARFHAEASAGLLEAGVLRLYALKLNGEVIGAFMGFHHAARAYYYLGGFNPAFAAFSPGALLIGHALEQAVCAGARAFDFLRGCESYKYAWGAADEIMFGRQINLHV